MRFLLPILVVLAAAFPVQGQSKKPPNIIVILADDLGWGDVSINGRKEWKTKNLERMAKKGTKFNRWYTAAVVCAPSRAALLTGKYTIHNKVSANNEDLPRGEVTLAEALKALGYATGLFGKWHQGRPRDGEKSFVHPLEQGFDETFGYLDAKHAWEKFPKQLWQGKELVDVKPGSFADSLFADKSIDFMKRNRDRPFFLYVPFVSPHFHVEAPEEDVKEFAGKFPEKDPKNPVRARYAAMISRLDKEVGRVLDAVKAFGLEENTIIIFTSDHGATFEMGNMGASAFLDSNFPFRGQKRTLFEGGTRVPALVVWPGHVPEDKTREEPVHMIDLFPTLVRAAGGKCDPAWKVDGADLLDFWCGKEKGPPDRTLFWEWRWEGAYNLAAMKGDFKYYQLSEKGKAEMVNVVADPGERRNVIAEHPTLAKQLQAELREWLATEGKGK